MKRRIAIIGAASGQLPLCQKARKIGLETYCFANKDGGCAEFADHFIPVSIIDKETVARICREQHIDAIATNASELTASVAAYVAEQLGTIGPSYKALMAAHNKAIARSLANDIEGFTPIRFSLYSGTNDIYPCVVKPTIGAAKKGVSFVETPLQFQDAITYASTDNDAEILIEEYIDGKELSIECLSYKGKHYIVQITDKDSSGPPHFAELGHHQPAIISETIRQKIYKSIPNLLSILDYSNGPSHIECKYKEDELYLIEANLRGGGDAISNQLVQLSTGVDYLKGIIDIALGIFQETDILSHTNSYAGIYYLCAQTAHWLPFFEAAKQQAWFVEGQIYSTDLHESHSNYERDGYLIYKSSRKIIPQCNE